MMFVRTKSQSNEIMILLPISYQLCEIDEEKAPIYNNDGENYDESNVLEENTITITSDKIVALTKISLQSHQIR